MPDITTHLSAAATKPIIGGGTSFFSTLLLNWLGVTTPIFVAAALGAIVAVVMLGKHNGVEAFGIKVKPSIVSMLTSVVGGIAACYGFALIEPLAGLKLPQAPATAFLAFILVYFLPLILDVVKNRIEGLKK